ncbi:hypothetical protein ACFLZW_02010 [Chloroflexota bacterium]
MEENEYLDVDELEENELLDEIEEVLDPQDRKLFNIALWSENLSKIILGVGLLL